MRKSSSHGALGAHQPEEPHPECGDGSSAGRLMRPRCVCWGRINLKETHLALGGFLTRYSSAGTTPHSTDRTRDRMAPTAARRGP